MRAKLFIGLVFYLFVGKALAQELRQKNLSFETGIDFIFSEPTKMDFVRGDVPSYYNLGEATSNLSSLQFKNYLGIKAEVFTLNNKFALTGGIRYTHLYGAIGKQSYWYVTTSDFFYVLVTQNNSNTELMKVKEVTQSSHYVGVPLELKFFPMSPHLIQIYFKAGLEFNFRVKTKTDVVFSNDDMSIYKNKIADLVRNPGNFCAVANGAAGLRIGRPYKINFSLEGNLPVVFITQETTGVVNPLSGVGFQCNLYIPLKKVNQNLKN